MTLDKGRRTDKEKHYVKTNTQCAHKIHVTVT